MNPQSKNCYMREFHPDRHALTWWDLSVMAIITVQQESSVIVTEDREHAFVMWDTEALIARNVQTPTTRSIQSAFLESCVLMIAVVLVLVTMPLENANVCLIVQARSAKLCFALDSVLCARPATLDHVSTAPVDII